MQKQIHPANRRLLMKQQCANRGIFLRLDDVLINRIEVKIFLSWFFFCHTCMNWLWKSTLKLPGFRNPDLYLCIYLSDLLPSHFVPIVFVICICRDLKAPMIISNTYSTGVKLFEKSNIPSKTKHNPACSSITWSDKAKVKSRGISKSVLSICTGCKVWRVIISKIVTKRTLALQFFTRFATIIRLWKLTI